MDGWVEKREWVGGLRRGSGLRGWVERVGGVGGQGGLRRGSGLRGWVDWERCIRG